MSSSTSAAPGKLRRNSPRPYVIAGYVVIFLMFGVIGGWAATAKIASAIISTGTVSLEGNRKVVQHLEGGLVREIHVREADTVEEGEVLITLDELQAASNLEVLLQRREVALANEARLNAERIFADEIAFPEELLETDAPEIEAALLVQRNIFADRRSILTSRAEILQARVGQLQQQIDGLELQKNALERRQALRTELVERLRAGEERGVVEGNRLNELEDGLIQIEASLGEIISQIAQAQASIGETELNLIQIRQEYAERASVELRTVGDELTELSERIRVAQDLLDRTAIRAPTSGTVQNLQIHTEGSVIRAGDTLMEVVPKDEELVILAQIAPTDIDNVVPGQETEVRFSAFKAKLTPVVLGQIQTVSNDVLQSTGDAPPYYLARIVVEESEMPDNVREGLTAGMPVDVVVPTGERSVFYYLVQPLADVIAKSMREE